jgi:hypothetical protein
LQAAERALDRRVLVRGSFAYRCRLCRTWHTSRSAMPGELRRIKEQAAILIAASMTATELAALVARWSPDAAPVKRKPKGKPKAERLTQNLGDLWPGHGRSRIGRGSSG